MSGSLCLAAIRQMLAAFPDAPLRIQDRGSSLVIEPTGRNTFPISVFDEGDDVMIAAERRWHGHETEPSQAAALVFWLLSPLYRVVQEFKGGLMVTAWLESYEDGDWLAFAPVYFLNPEYLPDWQLAPDESATHRIIQQDVLRPFGGREMPEIQSEPVVVTNDRLFGPELLEPESD